MGSTPDGGSRRSTSLDEVILGYLRALRSGKPPSRAELLAAHPDLAEQLRVFFAALDASTQEAEDTSAPEANTASSTVAYVPSDAGGMAAGRRFGDYELLEQIGRGGMGIVFKARQVSLNRLVALKVIRTGELADEQDVARFHREAETAANLDHPGIVPIFEVGEIDGRHFYSMGFVEGTSLSDELSDGPLPLREAAGLIEKTTQAVAYAHVAGVIHRDLKPSNILLDGEWQPRVADFGLARRIETDSELTLAGKPIGTPSYMPPEQASGKLEEIGPPADVYSLGATLYAAVTGRAPFSAASRDETLRQVREEEPVSPRQLNPAVDRDLETICLKCLEKEPGARYASAAAVAEDLQRYLAGQPIHARPISRAARVVRWCRRRPAMAALLAAVAVLLSALSGGGYVAYLREAGLRAVQARQLAESYVQTAKLDARKGKWRDSIGQLQRALDIGHHPDPIAVRLEIVNAYNALNDLSGSRREIEALAQRSDLNGHQGEVLLWQADLMLTEAEGDDEQDAALALVQKALEHPLLASSKQYAHALLAEGSLDALTFLDRALAADPFHPRANVQRAVSLLSLGDRTGARRHAEASRLVFPEDPNYPVVLACVAALENDLATAEAHLVSTDEVDAEAVERFRARFAELRGLVRPLFDNWDQGGWDIQTTARFARFLKNVEQDVPVIRRGRLLRAPPALSKVWQLLFTSALKAMLAGEAAEIGKAAKAHPEGTLFFLQGQMLFSDGKWADAEAAFANAAKYPALFPEVEREATFAAATCATMLFVTEKNEEALARSLPHLHRRLKLGPLKPSHARLVARMFRRSEEYDWAGRVLRDTLKQHTGDPVLLVQLAEIELEGGNYRACIDTTDKVLAKNPDHAEAAKFRKQAAAAMKRSLQDQELKE